jgi:hypothetical protein
MWVFLLLTAALVDDMTQNRWATSQNPGGFSPNAPYSGATPPNRGFYYTTVAAAAPLSATARFI